MAIWMAALQAIGQANQKEAEIRIQKANAGVLAKQAEMQGNLYGMQLEQNFNKAMASDVVMSASQGRRGGSVEAIAGAALKQFNWDLDFSELSTEIQMNGLNANLASLESAQDSAAIGGFINVGISGYNEYNKSQERKSINQKDSLLKVKGDK